VVAGTDATVVDFWRFTLPILRMNNARGYLDEFLATGAIGLAGLRVKWDSYNALTLNGTTIGVEASTYLETQRLMGFVPQWDARGCAGTALVRSRSTQRSRIRGPIGWCTQPRIKRSRILPLGSNWDAIMFAFTQPWGTAPERGRTQTFRLNEGSLNQENKHCPKYTQQSNTLGTY